MIPNDDCYCEIDPEVKDRWGIPVLRFHWKWADYETRQAAHMIKTFADIIQAMGGKPAEKPELNGPKAIEAGGKITHRACTTLLLPRNDRSSHNQNSHAV